MGEVIPTALMSLVAGRQTVGTLEQAFPVLTVDALRFPHVALLSRSELEVSDDHNRLLAVVASPRTRENLFRERRAGLIAVSGDTAHYFKLGCLQLVEHEGVLGVVFEVVDYKQDTAGVELSPITYTTTRRLARSEEWDRSARVLHHLTQCAQE